MKMNADGTLSVPAQTLTTTGVEQLLKDLARARQDMSPPVATEFGPHLGRNFVDCGRPSAAVMRISSGAIVIAFRHEGLGWISIELEPSAAAFLAKAIQKRTEEPDAFGANGPGDGGAVH